MQRVVQMLQRTAPLWILWIACAGTAEAQRPQTTVVNDTSSSVTVIVVNPPFPPLDLNKIPAGQSSTIGAPAGATLQIVECGTGKLVKEIPVTKTRKVALTDSDTPKPKVPDATSPDKNAARSVSKSSNSKNSEGTLHVILACDVDDPALGEGFEINEGVVRTQFWDSVATRNLRYYSPWTSGALDARPELTAQNLLKEIDEIQLQPNDTLMVYLACHGFWDKDDDEHWFRFENDNDDSALLRKTLISRIKSRKTRLGMLVTDACTNYEKLPSDRVEISPLHGPLEKTAPLYQSLFFDQQGFLDLSSSSPGQFTMYYNNYKDLKKGENIVVKKLPSSREIPGGGLLVKYGMSLEGGDTMKGGLFTESMRSLLLAKSDEKLDWKEFTDLLSTDVENRFDEENPDGELETGAGTVFQDAQTISVNEFPGSPGDTDTATEPDRKMAKGRDSGKPTEPEPASFDASEKFGVTGYKNDKGGFVILEVIEDTPAARLGLKVGEVIEKVNNQPVNTPEELEEALAKAAATFRITVDGAAFVVRP